MRSAIIAFMVMVAAVCCPSVRAGEADEGFDVKPAEVTITGKVAVVTDNDGEVTAVTVIVAGEDAVVYNITMDEKGAELARLAGKEAKVTGTVVVKDEAKWLTVTASAAVIEW